MMKKQDIKKNFIITIDTEGDNLWEYTLNEKIETRNAAYLPRFQMLCNKYGYKPVYLSNYEMINSSMFIDFVSKEAELGNCEIGMHLHAWNTPPEYMLPNKQNNAGLPYLIEYPREIMEEKIDTMTDLIYQRTGYRPVSHRAGRWTMNQNYFDILIDHGYMVDCSITPYINWVSSKGYTQGSVGSDYRKSERKSNYIYASSGKNRILEVPVTTYRKIIPKVYQGEGIKSVLKTAYSFADRKVIWLRPMVYNLKEMMRVIELNEQSDSDYLMFMIHSSELMPGGSPTFKNNEEIEELYKMIDIIFERIRESYIGVTLAQYANGRKIE